MKLTKHLLFVLFFILFSFQQSVKAQSYSIEILGGNVLNGVLQGAVLGGAGMALADSKDPGPIRVGVGLGILYGVGVGVHDIQKAEGQKLLVQGSFNNGNNTSIIVLLDTGYGAAAGAVLATAGMLVANEPLINGIQYGASVGAIIGFGFGIFDGFILAEHGPSAIVMKEKKTTVNGLITMASPNRNLEMGFLAPTVFNNVELNSNSITNRFDFGVQAVNLKIGF